MIIGMCDSGVGGLTVLEEVKKNFGAKYIYLADLKNCPFGDKTKDQLIEILYSIFDFFYNKKVDLIVIACGTLSSIVSNLKIQEYKGIKVVNVVNAICSELKDEKIANSILIATKSTINQGEFKKILKYNIPDLNVIDIACPKFVDIIENGKSNSNEADQAIELYLKDDDLKKCNKQYLILGCTHYPILKEKIEARILKSGYDIKIITPGEAVVKYLKKNIAIEESNISFDFYTTKESKVLEEFTKIMITDFNKVQKIEIKKS